MNKPLPEEYNAYFQKYIDLLPDENASTLLKANTIYCRDFFNSLPEALHNYRYAPDKWTVKQVFMHIIDTERGFAYRTFVCARCDDKTILYPMDDMAYATQTDVSNRSMESLVEEFMTVRRNTEILFEHMSEAQSRFVAKMSNGVITARAMGFITAGHLLHHINIIKERYL